MRGRLLGGRLESLSWRVWDAEPSDTAVTVAFTQPGSAAGANHPVEAVEVLEEPRRVIVTLYQRVVGGGGKLAAVHRALRVPLQAPLGDRAVSDGHSGDRMPRPADAPDFTAGTRLSSVLADAQAPPFVRVFDADGHLVAGGGVRLAVESGPER